MEYDDRSLVEKRVAFVTLGAKYNFKKIEFVLNC